MKRGIGKSVPGVDVIDKVTGRAKYAADLTMGGMLHMKLVLSERPHAQICSIDTSLALNHPGVVDVLTAQDVPVNSFGLILTDRQVLCEEIVRHVGDPIAAVMATTVKGASEAAKMIKVKYKNLPIVQDPCQALEPNAPIIHPEAPDNILHKVHSERGDVESAFKFAEVIVERTYHTPMQEHAFLEPEAGIAYIDEKGRITIRTAGQCVHDDREQLSSILNVPPDQVRVIYGPIGGAFGGREALSILQPILAVAAWKTRKPIKAVLTRRESILGHTKRHRMTLKYKYGANKEGDLIAAKVNIVADAGAYDTSSKSVIDNMVYSAVGPYEIPNVNIDAKAVYTNNVPAGAFRGYGFPQVVFAAELQIEHIAEEIGIDPITMRLRNCWRDDSITPTRSPVPGKVNLHLLIQECAEEAGYVKNHNGWVLPKLNKTTGDKCRGMGLAAGMKSSGYGLGFPESSEAKVMLYGEGDLDRVEVHTAATDYGQGSHTVLAQIASETLDVPLDRIEMITSDTADDVGNSGPAAAQRLTIVAGRAVQRASDLALLNWRKGERPGVGKVRWNAPPTTAPDPETGGCLPAFSFSYGAHAVEVEVDVETGEIRLTRVIVAHDPGKMINPDKVIGQIHGGAVQAVGWSIIENFIVERGNILTDELSTYLIPTAKDIPLNFQRILHETQDDVGPYGARGIGEITFIPLAPAIVSAVHNAISVWFDSIPLNQEKVFRSAPQKLDTPLSEQ